MITHFSKAYQKAYKTNQYEGMHPGRIILALFDGMLSSLERAKEAIETGKVAERGVALGKAIAIIGELQGALSPEAAPELAARLNSLYDHAQLELVYANLHADARKIAHIQRLMKEVRDGWAEMMDNIKEETKTEEPDMKAVVGLDRGYV